MINELIEKCREFKIEQERSKEDDYRELVVDVKDLDKIKGILQDYFGPAVKDAGERPSDELTELTKNYGGLKEDQVLYKKTVEDNIIIAIIWIWKNGIYATLKLSEIKK